MNSEGLTLIACSCRIRGVRCRQLGWKPVSHADEIYETLPAEVDFILRGVVV